MKYSILLGSTLLLLSACDGSAGSSSATASSSSSTSDFSSTSSSGDAVSSAKIRLNQLGYPLKSHKLALVDDVNSTTFAVVDTDNKAVVFNGTLSSADTWPPAEQTVKQADFSALTTPGAYRLMVDGAQESYAFTINDTVYHDLHDAAVKAYYFNRASTALGEQYASVWARAAGHPDNIVLVHSSAATAERPEGTVIAAAKGWYDAGDYNKYVVNSGISTYTLLAALEHFPAFYSNRHWNIPESADDIPDLLNEILWNLDWLVNMQDTDGGVYHKLTTKDFAGMVMPAAATDQRYVVQKTTAATLNFAAVMATASRVVGEYEAQLPGKAAAYRAAAISAWQWTMQPENQAITYQQPSDIHTGAYGDDVLTDEFAWAAAELFLLTGDESYWQTFNDADMPAAVPSWGFVSGLAYVSLLERGETSLSTQAYQDIIGRVLALADDLVKTRNQSAYGVSMTTANFHWGSNSAAMNQAMMLLQANRHSGDDRYLKAAQDLLDYVLGRNATDYSFVTGYGDRTPQNIHHRPSAADGVVAPVPGFLVGGPHSGQQEKEDCNYPSSLPAQSYSDSWCSYSTNEVTINWNAPLVYVLAAIISN